MLDTSTYLYYDPLVSILAGIFYVETFMSDIQISCETITRPRWSWIWPWPSPRPRPVPFPPPVPSTARLDAIRAIINRERGSRGLASLVANASLELASQRHSDDMNAHRMLTHTGSDGSKLAARLTGVGYSYRAAGEIIAATPQGYAEEAVVRLWIDSPPHNAIMFSPAYADFGGGEAGGYWTVDFGARA